MRKLRIAMLAHSTNPRGGVVHAMQLAEALTADGHETVLFAPDATGKGFFRTASCETVPIPVGPAPADIAAMVAMRVQDYTRHFDHGLCGRFDVFHAQDTISANALAALREQRCIRRFARTVHHIDDFADPRLTALQLRGINAASVHFTVSRQWRDVLARNFGRCAEVVGNGVDADRFCKRAEPRDAVLRARLQLGQGPIIVTVGGVERRKNTLALLRAFCALHELCPEAQLVIAGGASLLDHTAYAQAFAAALQASHLPEGAVQLTGTLAQEDMPSLYRLADAFAFPSLREGYGLAVLEAMACGVPVIVPHGAPFDEYIGEDDAAWCDPCDPASILQALQLALAPGARRYFIRGGLRIAARHDWAHVAWAHLAFYGPMVERFQEHHHA